jgi:replicative DNA helicase
MYSAERLPPNSLSGEESLLGLLLMNSESLPIIVQSLEVSDFYSPAHQKIYAEIKKLNKKNKPVDLVTVTLALETSQQLTNIGGKPKLADLVQKGYMCYNPEEVITIIKHNSVKRKLLSATHDIAGQLYDPSTDVLELIQEYSEILLGFSDMLRTNTGGLKDIADIMPDVITDIELLNSEEDTSTLATGLYDLDKLTGGIPRGAITVIAGRAGMGKTTVSLELTMNLAKKNKKVAYFSLEMTNVQIAKKIIARTIAGDQQYPKISATNLFRSGGLKGLQELELFTAAIPETTDLSIWIDDYSSASASYIRNELTKLIQKGDKPDTVVVDYVGLMGSEAKNQTRVLELDTTLKELRAIAKDFDVAMICLAQINRTVESQADKRPALKDIRESGGYEQEAALVLGLYNPDKYKNEGAQNAGVLEILVLKNRFGDTGKVKVGFEPQYNRLLNLAF